MEKRRGERERERKKKKRKPLNAQETA